MSTRAWAKFPSAWVKATNATLLGDQPVLTGLQWQSHRAGALAALVILVALAIRLNESKRGKEFDATNPSMVSVTYDDLQSLTGFARATVAKGLMHLEALRAIKVHKQGRASAYELIGVAEKGGWCALPQGFLMDGAIDSATIPRLADLPRKRISLCSMKVYLVLLTFRDQRLNTTAISYSALMRYTGVRREDIPKALSQLTALELVSVSDDTDARSSIDKSQRYKISGLYRSG